MPRETIVRSGSCAGCGTKTTRLRLCTRCRGVGYCSKPCQAKHWSTFHKARCIPTRRSGSLPLGELIQEKFELTRSERPRSCTNCSSPLESFRTRIWMPPKVLVVHLDRRHKVYGKISTCAPTVSYRLILRHAGQSNTLSPPSTCDRAQIPGIHPRAIFST